MSDLYFYNYEETNWGWTNSAVQRFISGFKRFGHVPDNKEQVYVGVYGPTQVGKTTFILTLLGISFSYIGPLSEALRGGREKGKSATVTCTIFQRSETDDFQVIWPTGEYFQCETTEVLQEIIRKLRLTIYENESFPTEPVVIKIPRCYFNEEDIDKRVRDLAIIDLPGDDSKDAVEMRHVNHILKEYISRCKVCIIMEISSQMTGLTKLDKELVKDWLVLPEQFRILLTRSVTNSSVMKKIITGEILDTQDFHQEYIDELSRVCETDRLATNVYPLEFGDSWLDLKKTNPSLFEQADSWVSNIFNTLVEDLTSIYSPEQEIKKLKSMERFIVKRKEEELSYLDKQISFAKDDYETFNQELEQLDTVIKKNKKAIERLKNIQNSWEEFRFPEIRIEPIISWEEAEFYQKKRSYLEKQYHYCIEEIKEQAAKHVELLNQKVRRENRAINLRLRQVLFPSHLFDVYFSIDHIGDRYIFAVNYNKDREIALTRVTVVKNDFEKMFKRYVQQRAKEVELEIKKAEDKLSLLCQEFQNAHHSLQVREKHLYSLKTERNRTEIEWAEDQSRSNELDRYLMDSFVEQSAIYKKKLISSDTSTEERWHVHQQWNLLKKQAERIIDHVE